MGFKKLKDILKIDCIQSARGASQYSWGTHLHQELHSTLYIIDIYIKTPFCCESQAHLKADDWSPPPRPALWKANTQKHKIKKIQSNVDDNGYSEVWKAEVNAPTKVNRGAATSVPKLKCCHYSHSQVKTKSKTLKSFERLLIHKPYKTDQHLLSHMITDICR